MEHLVYAMQNTLSYAWHVWWEHMFMDIGIAIYFFSLFPVRPENIAKSRDVSTCNLTSQHVRSGQSHVW